MTGILVRKINQNARLSAVIVARGRLFIFRRGGGIHLVYSPE